MRSLLVDWLSIMRGASSASGYVGDWDRCPRPADAGVFQQAIELHDRSEGLAGAKRHLAERERPVGL